MTRPRRGGVPADLAACNVLRSAGLANADGPGPLWAAYRGAG